MRARPREKATPPGVLFGDYAVNTFQPRLQPYSPASAPSQRLPMLHTPNIGDELTTVIGDVRDVSRFRGRDRFAAYNGTAPIEVSSGNRVICRLSLGGNRRLNHAIHMAAITQIRYKHSDGRACYDKKAAEGKTPKEALRALERQISDAIYRCLKAGAARIAAVSIQGPGGHAGNDSAASVAGSLSGAGQRRCNPGCGGNQTAGPFGPAVSLAAVVNVGGTVSWRWGRWRCSR